jgi:hypothetical protein
MSTLIGTDRGVYFKTNMSAGGTLCTNLLDNMSIEMVRFDELWEWRHRIAFWRDPKGRMEAAYRHFRFHGGATMLPWEDWMDGVLMLEDSQRDDHMKSQWWHHTYHGAFMPTRVIHWDFHEWSRYFGTPYPPKDGLSPSDVHTPTPWNAVLTLRFEQEYRRDFEIWNQRPHGATVG